MLIEVNPKSLKNLEQICEVLYCLHPSVLDYMCKYLIDDMGDILGEHTLENQTFEERESLMKFNDSYKAKKVNWDENGNIYYTDVENPFYQEPIKKEKEEKEEDSNLQEIFNEISEKFKQKKVIEEKEEKEIPDFKELVNCMHGDGEYPEDIFVFKRLLKYLQLDTYEYIPIKIYVEVEDPVVRKKVRKLINFLERTDAPEQIYLHKREVDCDAYFAEGYGLTMNEDQKKKMDDFYDGYDYQKLKKLLIKEKLYYY